MKNRIVALIVAVIMLTACFPTVTFDRPADGSEPGIKVSAGTSAEAAKPKPKKVKITGSKYVAKGKKITLKATVTPEGADQKVKWTSSNKSIATVSSKGVVKGKKAGKVKITATSKKNPKAKKTFTVTVKKDAVKSVKITGAPATLKVGGTVKLKAAATPKKAAQSFDWTSNDKTVATVSSSGEVKALKKGKVTITATATDGSKKKTTAVIEIVDGSEPQVDVNGVVIDDIDASVPLNWKLNYSTVLSATVSPNNATKSKVSWISSDTGILQTKTNGTVTAVGCGTATIRAVATDGTGIQSDPITINVWSVSIQDLPEYMKCDETVELKATARPDNAPEIQWSLSDETVAEIVVDGDKKVLKPLKDGKVKVTAALSGLGIKDTKTVQIVTRVTGITITDAPAEMFAGDTAFLSAEIEPEEASVRTVNWSSNNSDVLTVSASGKVTAVSYGEAEITASAKDGSGVESAPVTIKVWNVLQGVSITGLPNVMDIGDTPDLSYKITPATDTLKDQPEVSWSVTPSGDNPGAALFENGKLIPSQAGTVTVTATVEGTEIKDEKTVTIGRKVTGITISTTADLDDIYESDEIQFSVSVEPEDATDRRVEWSVSDSELASIDNNGKLTAIKNGTVTVTALAKDGSGTSDSMNITIKNSGITVRSISANTTEGTVGDSIIWTVDAVSDETILSYLFTLKKDGETVDTKQSSSATYSQVANNPGSYTLSVEVTNAAGKKAKATSSVLFIAQESMNMTVPATLANGKDLEIQVGESPNALKYSIYLTNETTGEYIGHVELNKPNKIVFEGYKLDEGTLRVTGYVYGNDFRYSVPTVKKVVVSGSKTQGPVIPAQDPITLGHEIGFCLSNTEAYVVKYQYRYADGILSEEHIGSFHNKGEICWVWPFEEGIEKWEQGGAVLLRGAVKRNGTWTDWGKITEVTVLTVPKLDTPVINAPASAPAGKDLTVSFASVDHASEYYFYITKGYNPNLTDIDEENRIYNDWYISGGTKIIPGYHLSTGVYTLWLYAWDHEYQSSDWARKKLTITGNRPLSPVVSAVMNKGNLAISIQSTEAERAYGYIERWHNDQKFDDWDYFSLSLDEEGKGTYTEHYNFGNDHVGQVLRIRVSALTDGIWSDYCEDVTVQITMNDLPHQLCGPEVFIQDSLQAGESLSFYFDPVEGADYYEANLLRIYDNEYICSWYSNECQPNRNLTISGYLLSSGSYRLIVRAESYDGESASTEIIITVTGSKPAAPIVGGYPEEVHIKEKITFSIDTQDAEGLVVEYDRKFGNDKESYRYNLAISGDTTSWSYTFGEYEKDDIYIFRFAVKRENKWSAWKTVTKTILDLPPLQSVVIHSQDSYEAGENIIFSFDAVENAEKYYWRIIDYNDNYIDYGNLTVPTTIEVNGYNYKSGTYTIEVFSSSDSYSTSVSEHNFMVTGSRPSAPDVSVDKTEVYDSNPYTFTIDTTNADQLICQYYVNYSDLEDNGWWDSTEINVLDTHSTKWTTSTYYDNGGTMKYCFTARINGRWTAWSDPISVTSIKTDSTAPVSINVPATLATGQDLAVTINEENNFNYYYIYLYNNNGTEIAQKIYNNPGAYTFEGYYMTTGTYTVKVCADNNNYSSTAHATVSVISGARPAAPEISAETEFGRANVYYGFTLSTVGADKAVVRYYREGYPNNLYYDTFNCADDTTRWTDRKTISGQVWKYAFAVKKDGVWSSWSSASTVTITDREILEKPTLNIPNDPQAGSDIYISFTGVEHADSYYMTLTYPNGSKNDWTAYPDTQRRLLGYDLGPGSYKVSVTASAAEYESNTATATFRIIGTREDAPAVSVNKDEVFTNETYTFTINTTGAEEVAYRITYGSGSYSSGTLNVLSDKTVWDTYAYSSTIRNYSFCILKDGRWSEWSDEIQITINDRPQLSLPYVDVPDTLLRGQDLTVTVNAVENATEYDVYLYNDSDQCIASKYSSTPGDFIFNGYLLKTGSYRIQVSVYGLNGSGGYVSRNLQVNDAQLPESPQVTPPDQTTVSSGTSFYFNIVTEGAEKAAVRYYRIGSPNDLSTQTFSVNTEGSVTSWRGYQYNGGNTYAYSFAVQKNGVWSEWSSFTEIIVE